MSLAAALYTTTRFRLIARLSQMGVNLRLPYGGLQTKPSSFPGSRGEWMSRLELDTVNGPYYIRLHHGPHAPREI